MKHLVLGFGDVGRAITEILQDKFETVAVDKNANLKGQFDVLHVCFPFSEKFIEQVLDYAEEYNPSLVIIHSTVSVGTTYSLNKIISCVHSPVRGRHPSMVRDMRTYTKYFAGEKSREAAKIFEDCGIKVFCFDKPETTELGKLLCNIRWGLNLAFAQEQKRMCEFYGVNYEDVVNEFEKSRNEGLVKIARSDVQMPILYPGYIGGHCVMPNVDILFASFPSVFLKAILESNDRYGKKL